MVAGGVPNGSASPEPPRPERHHAFISYSHRDHALARRLRDALEALGRDVWLDERSIPPAATWADELRRAIESADAFVFLASPAAVASAECRQELKHAQALNKKVIGVRVGDVDPATLPATLASRQLIPARGAFEDSFEEGLALLVDALDTDLEWTRAHTEWAGKALEWERHQRERSYLLAGAELEAAEAWRATAPGKRPEMTALHAEFIDASRRAAVRRLRRTRAAVSVALVIAVALAAVALVARQAAVSAQHDAQARALTAEAASQLGSDPELALLLALRGNGVRATSQGALVLRQAVATDQLRHVLAGHRGRVWGVAFDPVRDDVLASAGADRTVRVWNLATARATVLRSGPAHGAGFRDLAFSPDGRLLAAGSSDGTIRLWRVPGTPRSWRVLHAPGGARVTSVQFISADLLLATTGQGSAVWALPAPTPYSQTPRGTPAIRFASVSGDASAVVFAGDDNVALVSHGKKTVLAAGGVPTLAEFSPDSSRLVSALAGGQPQLWTAVGRHVADLDAEPGVLGRHETAFSSAFDGSGALLAVGYDDGVVGVFRPADGHVVEVIRSTRGPVRSVAFGGDDDLAVTGFDGSTRVWDPYTGQQLAVLTDGSAPVLAAATTRDGTELATAAADGRVRVWEPAPGRAVYRAPAGTVFASLEPEGRAVAAVSDHDVVTLTALGSSPHRITMLGRFPGAARRVPPAIGPGAHVVVLAQDSRLVAVAARRGRRVPLAGSRLDPDLSQPLRFASFTPDGERVVAPAAGRRVLVWSTASGAVVARLAVHPAAVTDALFSPDGRLVASTDGSGSTDIQPADGRGAVVTLHGAGSVADMAFSPDGRVLATAGPFGNALPALRLWSVSSGRPIGTAATGYGGVVAFAPDGSRIVTQNATGSAAVLPVGPDGLGRRAAVVPAGVVTDVAFTAAGDPLVADIRGISLYDRRTQAVVGQFGGARSYYGFELAGSTLLALPAPTDTPASGAPAPGGATAYACDACAAPPALPRVARSLAVRGFTPAEIARFVRGS